MSFFSFLDIVAIRIFDSAATNVSNVHFVNRCECDVRSYILYVCFNSLIHLYFTAFNSCVCSCIYVNKKKKKKRKKKRRTTLEAKVLEGQGSYYDANFCYFA